ncbi:LAMI_0D09516g1_1 [Lachancea mirantina]|uniref:LAMI_0D09516g1_1 n=1 Tax=Lachancea mirantina TaxID=1230905 RepID=A0A1G4JDM2_9SACH|nr:LAMI_0D09516g1_1 [Lachancea mirantina]
MSGLVKAKWQEQKAVSDQGKDLRPQGGGVFKPQNSNKAQCSRRGDQPRISQVAIQKLNDIFDFRHFLKDHHTSATHTASPYTHGRRIVTEEEQSFLPLEDWTTVKHSDFFDGGQGPQGPTSSSLASSLHEIPSRSSTMKSFEYQVLLHDLISGDIYED